MPYTVQKKDDSLELFAKFMETPAGEAFLAREWEKFRRIRELDACAQKVGQPA